ncbi:hypothetical protein ACWT_1910 [Actinoplanes sp. SE50]|nr:hypothetical protein ACPL_2032 [Actinoplanes sp. SE50/110]ATO81325.1 hypothetical protein ACWT_1910 [Actinoplanes sp. SE50]SLL98732.1 hypothetical protein ACSP50_1959 [Actinoplanes sp. SE50/110]
MRGIFRTGLIGLVVLGAVSVADEARAVRPAAAISRSSDGVARYGGQGPFR